MALNRNIVLIQEKKTIYWDKSGKTTVDINILTDKYFTSIGKAKKWIIDHLTAIVWNRYKEDNDGDNYNRTIALRRVRHKLSIDNDGVEKSYTPISIPSYCP